MRVYFLDIPSFGYGEDYIRPKGATYNKRLKAMTYTGDILPDELKPYHSKDFSLLRWREDQYNRKIYPIKPFAHKFTPKPHQKEAAIKITKAKKQGYRGFVEGDGTGIGKTLASIYGIYGASKTIGQKSIKVLIVCPKSAIPQWSNTFKSFPLPHARICIVNYEQCMKLLKAPASASNVKRKATQKKHTYTKGSPTVEWDYIVADESHKLKNEGTERAQAFSRIAKYQESSKNSPFVIWASATVGQNILELQYLFPLLKQITRDTEKMTWVQWLEKYDFNIRVAKKTGNVRIDDVLAKQDPNEFDRRNRIDAKKINKILFSPNSPSIRRTPSDIEGWPEIQRIAQSIELDTKEHFEYMKQWLQFRADRKLIRKGKNPSASLVRELRFRQKSSILRIPHTVEFVADLVENNHQVAIYCQFMESVDGIMAGLARKGIKATECTGRNEDEREKNRIEFQKGHAKVVIFSVKEAISFHADEILSDGTSATSNPRVSVMHDLNYSGIASQQIEGRCHRSGTFAPVYYLYAKNTNESKVAHRMVERIQNISLIMDDEKFADELADLLSE